MFLLRTLSDLHNEFGEFDIPPLPTDSQTVLSLAGDIYTRKRLMEWLRPLAARFKAVVVCLGNHDYWKGDADKTPQDMRQWIRNSGITNIHLLVDDYVEIDGTVFFGGTCWTDLNKKDPLTMISFGPYRDFKRIRYNHYDRRWSTREAYQRHQLYKQRLVTALELPEHAGKRFVVLSHHAPHSKSCDDRFVGDHIGNGFYISDLSDIILDHPQIAMWHHGHLHSVADYMIGDDCRVICMPRGYAPDDLVDGFDPYILFDLDAVKQDTINSGHLTCE